MTESSLRDRESPRRWNVTGSASRQTSTLFRRVLAGLATGLFLAQAAAAQPAHSGFPVDISIAKTPAPVTVDGRTRLLYELRVTNFYAGSVELDRVEVRAPDGRGLATLSGKALDAQLMLIGAGDDTPSPHVLGGGRAVVAFIDLALAPGAAAPAALSHAFTFKVLLPDGRSLERVVVGAPVRVGPAAPIIAAPLRGAGWVAANGLGRPDHRRSFNAVDGQEHLAQRLAIDWVRLAPDGRFFHGDPKVNASYAGYGEAVLAVANARVSAVTDGLPENAGNNPAAGRTVTLDSITGNSIVLDLGGGRYALYAHLIPSSIRVKVGDRVRVGQPMARLGNSGNSDAPHLHFQVMDAPSPLGSEGVPYAHASFVETGLLEDLSGLESGAPWRPSASAPRVARHNEFPLDNAVVDFGPARP